MHPLKLLCHLRINGNGRFELQILCRQYVKEIGADPKQNPVAHRKHLHEKDSIAYPSIAYVPSSTSNDSPTQ